MSKNEESKKNKESSHAGPLPALRPKVAGIDIGSTEHWVCGPARVDGERSIRAFGTTTDELNALVNWLAGQGVESVAMESTSVYWIPLYEILAEQALLGRRRRRWRVALASGAVGTTRPPSRGRRNSR